MAGTNSPDLTPYIDLRIYDKDPQEVVDTAIQDLETKMPEWIPREDNTEVMLIEAMSLEVAESIFAINRLPSAVLSALMKLYGVGRDEGAQPTANITMTMVDSFGYEIPAGTRFLLNLPGGLEPVVFSTNVAITIPDGSTTGVVAATGDRYTDAANDVPPGTSVELVDNLTFIETAAIATTVNGGRSPESDTDWLTRGVQRLRRLVSTLTVANHFTAAALEYPEVQRAKSIDLYMPGGTVGTNAGHITVFVYGDNAVVPTAVKSQMLADMQGRALANLTVHIADPTIATVNISVTVHKFDAYTQQQVRDGINVALGQYLSTDTWEWGTVVRRNELIALISNVAGVDYVTTLATPATDQTLTGVAPLAALGTVTVNFA